MTTNPYPSAEAPKAPAGTPAYSVWIWLVVFLPYVTLPLLFSTDFSPLLNPGTLDDQAGVMRAQLAILTSPQIILASVLGWVAAAAVVFASYRDWRWLQTVGVVKPFPWAWAFTSLAGYPVYAIGRSVVTKRRTGHGSAVMWVTIALMVLSFIGAIVWVAVLVTSIVTQMVPLTPGNLPS